MTAQRLVLVGGIPDGVWSCAWCAAELTSGVITHKDDCRWIEEIRAAERERIVAELRNRASSERDEAITTRSPSAADRHIHAATALDAAADLLDGDTDVVA